MFQLRTLAATAVVVAGVATAAVLPATSLFQEAPPMVPPTKVHDLLLESVGDWEGVLRMEMPGMPQTEFSATETVKGIGGYHTMSDFHADMMGAPYHGHGIASYDPKTETMLMTWSDSMQSHTSIMRGTVDMEKKTIAMKWEAPTMGADTMAPHRSVTKLMGDSYETNFFVGEGDTEIKMMTISMKRKK
ncbi:MAG: DUF1579 family protein [Planctomycetota bacterium]